MPDRNIALRQEIVALAHRHRRYGAGMIYRKLRQAGIVVNHKRVERLYAQQKLQIKRILDRFCQHRGYPDIIRTDNGKEFTGRAMLEWAHAHTVKLRLIEPGKPNQNAYIESFNSRFRDECLNERWFFNLRHARQLIEAWQKEYNEE